MVSKLRIIWKQTVEPDRAAMLAAAREGGYISSSDAEEDDEQYEASQRTGAFPYNP